MWRPSASLFKAQPCIWVTCTCAAARTSSQTTYTVTGVTGFVQLGPSQSVHLGKDAVYSIVSVLSSYKLLIPFLLQAWYPSLSWHLRLLFKKKKKKVWWFTQQAFISHSSGGWKSKIRMSAWSGLVKTFFLAFLLPSYSAERRLLGLHCPHPGGSTHMTSPNLNYLPWTPPTDTITSRIRASSTYEGGGHKHSVHNTTHLQGH